MKFCDAPTEKEEIIPDKVMDRVKIEGYLHLVREVYIAPHVRDYAARLVLATHPNSGYASQRIKQFVRYGSSPRGAQALVLAGKIKALLAKRYNVSFEDIKTAANPALRHRIILNLKAKRKEFLPMN